MLKIGIITCGKEPNYGACLQAFATQSLIQELGYDVDIMNYSFIADKSYSPFVQPSIKSAIIAVFFFFSRREQWKSFAKFRKKYMSYSDKRLFTAEDFKDIKNKYDIFVTGSDQVWNPELGIDLSITLQSFIAPSDNIRQISYASSFGVKSLNLEQFKRFKTALSGFDALSVREPSGAKIVNECIGHDCCKVVCDPVMLYDVSFWMKIMDHSRTPKTKYVVIYDMRHSKDVMDCALKIANTRHCKVIALSRIKMIRPGIKFVINLSPSQFLSLLYHSEAVVTDSFHGTVFSIIFHKEFYSFISKEGERIGDRLLHILDMCHLNNRLYSGSENIDFSPIDYSKVDPIVDSYRMFSRHFLKDSLDG